MNLSLPYGMLCGKCNMFSFKKSICFFARFISDKADIMLLYALFTCVFRCRNRILV